MDKKERTGSLAKSGLQAMEMLIYVARPQPAVPQGHLGGPTAAPPPGNITVRALGDETGTQSPVREQAVPTEEAASERAQRNPRSLCA